MNEIVNKFFLAGNIFMSEMNPNLIAVLVGNVIKIKKEYQKLNKQEIEDIFIKAN